MLVQSRKMNFEKKSANSGRAVSCSTLEATDERFTKPRNSSSLPTSLTQDLSFPNLASSAEHSTAEHKRNKVDSSKLVQNCGPNCMMTQRIVDRLLSRMLHLENERTELVAANRSWALQCRMLEERHENEIKKLKEELRVSKRENQAIKQRFDEDIKDKEKSKRTTNLPDTRDQVNLLTHQVEVYREDFLEERKARARAHAQIDSLKNELKRERKSCAKLSALVQQTNACKETTPAMT